MSTINKKPFIKTLLESLDSELLNTLSLLIDGSGNRVPILRTLSIKPSGNRSNITAADKGVKLCNLEANFSLYDGYLIYTDDYCILIAFTDSQKLTMFEISDDRLNFATIDEELSVTELRSELKDIAGGVDASEVVDIVDDNIDDGTIDIAGRFAAPAYDSSETYDEGDIVSHDNKIYVAKEGSVTGEWNSAKWDEKKLTELVGGSGGTSVALYKHTISNISIYDSDIDQIDTGNVLTFLSKYAEPFVSNGSLADILLFANDKNDTQIMISPTLGHPEGLTTMVANIMPDDDEVYFVAAIGGFPSYRFVAKFSDNATGLSDTVTPYISVAGSGGGGDTPVAGGSGKLYQLEFTAQARGDGGTYIVIANSDNELYSFDFKVLIYESEFERFVSEENGIILSDDEPLNIPTNINDFVSYLNNLFVLGGRTPEQFEVLDSLVNYSNKTLMSESSGGVIGEYDVVSPRFAFSDIHYSPSVNASKTLVYSHNYEPNATIENIVFSTPCTLTEYGTSASGSTVEAEPIISIKMTNMDCTGNDGSESRTIRDLQFYCTKERWDNFVSLASSMMSVDITYDNLDSVFKTLSVSSQATVLGYLLMDYYNGKVLPETYLQINQTVTNLSVKDKYGLSNLVTITDPQTNIEIVWSASFRGSNTSSDATLSESGVIPAPDMMSTNYYTADTVITVEEIDGASIGSSSGSSIDTTNLEVGHLTFNNNKTTGIKSLGSIWSVLSLEFETQYESYKFWAKYMCSEEEMYDLMNEQLEQYRQQGLTIPTVTDHDTLTQAFNTIIDTLFALDSSGAALNIAGVITLMFGPSVYGPFQGFMKDSGTTLFSLIRSGDDFGMCILDAQGQRVDVLQILVSDIGTTKPTNISVWIND